jgi:Rps23 Pro-64 3,4-dihydroxylase Tpa1-like proline 4-hydroxylase
MITKKLSSGNEIIIIDDLFSAIDFLQFEQYAMRSKYLLKSSTASRNSSRSNDELFFGADLSRDDIDQFGIFKTQEFLKISSLFVGRTIQRAWILCTESSTKYLYHSDHPCAASLTFLVYLNGFWHPEWGGETLFCDDKGDVELAVTCKPNRAVIFPSRVLHKPSGTSRDSRFRFTFSTTFIREN